MAGQRITASLNPSHHQARDPSRGELLRSKPTRGQIGEGKRLTSTLAGAHHTLVVPDRSGRTPFKVKEFGREGAIQKYEAHLRSSADLQQKLGQLSNKVLLCHCDLSEACHGNVLIRAWEEKFLSGPSSETDSPSRRTLPSSGHEATS